MDSVLPMDLPSSGSVLHVSHVLASFLPRWKIHLTEGKDYGVTSADSSGVRKFFTVGSEAEGLDISLPFYHRYSDNVDLQIKSDQDFVSSVLLPCPIGPYDEAETHIVLSTSDTKPGYLRVEHIPRLPPGERAADRCEPREYYGVDLRPEGTGESRTYMSLIKNKELHVQSMTDMLQSKYPDAQIELNGPAVTLDGIFDKWLDAEQSTDVSFAFECKTWPSVAAEWMTRARLSGWLSEGMMRGITDDGCFLVQVPHKQSLCPAVEFRFSFTLGEKNLAHSLTENQRQCYIVFKTLICSKLQPNTAVSSYCLKNILFWTLDKIPRSVWDNHWSGLGTCFLAMLDQLVHCLANYNLPHYFIRENNLIGHKPRKMVRSALRQLVIIRRHPIEEIFAFDDMYQSCLSINQPLSVVLSEFMHTACSRARLSEFRPLYLASCRRKLELTALEFRERDFSEIMHDASCGLPDFFWIYLRDFEIPEFSADSDRYGNPTHAIGVAWCSFIHLLHNEDEYRYVETTTLIRNVFDMACHQLGSNDVHQVIFHCRFAIFLHKNQQHQSALEAVQRILDWLPNHPLSIEEHLHYRVDMNAYNSIAFDPSLQTLIQPVVSMTTCVALACHTWIQCCLELHMADKARDILPVYIEHCKIFCNGLQATQLVRFMLRSLAQDQQLLGELQDVLPA